jgi:hypothetical protein
VAARPPRHRGERRLDQVLDLQRLDAGGVEDLGLVGQVDVLDALGDRLDLRTPSSIDGLRAEHAGVLLHRAADVVGDVLRVLAECCVVAAPGAPA